MSSPGQDPHHLLMPVANTDEPSADWARIRWNRGWQRLTDIEVYLTGMRERMKAPVVWRAVDQPEDNVNYHLVDPMKPEDMRELSLLGSEAVQHLRVALDHMVYNAGWKHSGEPPNRTAFPITGNPERWTQALKREVLPLSSEQKTWIEAVQPYNQIEWTRHLQRLSNADKHRYAMEISPALSMNLDHAAAAPDPADASRVLIPVKSWDIVLYVVEGDRREAAKPFLTPMFMGAAVLINRFAAQEGANQIKFVPQPGGTTYL